MRANGGISSGWAMHTLMLQQPALDSQWIASDFAGVTAQSLSGDHAMAGNQDRDGIGTAGAAYGAGGCP